MFTEQELAENKDSEVGKLYKRVAFHVKFLRGRLGQSRRRSLPDAPSAPKGAGQVQTDPAGPPPQELLSSDIEEESDR